MYLLDAGDRIARSKKQGDWATEAESETEKAWRGRDSVEVTERVMAEEVKEAEED